MIVRSRIVGLSLLAIGALGAWAMAAWLRPFGAPGQNLNSQGAAKAYDVELAIVGRGFQQITDIQFVPASDNRAVVLVKDGTARYVSLSETHAVTAEHSPIAFQVDVLTASELGLLGMVFHPKYDENGLFYVNYSPKGPRELTRVSEWRLPKRLLGYEKAEELRTILEVEQPYNNHNAGQLAFGPDGMLYIGMGDGGKRADPLAAGQDLGSLLGKMLRIDVDHKSGGREYSIPQDNPFVSRQGARPEIWAYGLRNPWRYSFDERGRLVVADVGQDEFEEVSIVERGDNLGWVVREGRHCFPPGSTCQSRGFKEPVFEYGRKLGQSITGGYVYQGKLLPALVGQYVCADYQFGNLWALELPDSARGDAKGTHLGRFPRMITTFGRGADGELYAGDFASGDLLRLVPNGGS